MGWSPQIRISTAYEPMPRPRVMISEASGEVPRRPMATTPTSIPTTAAASTASPSARMCGTPCPSSVYASMPASTAKTPWAKLTTRVTR